MTAYVNQNYSTDGNGSTWTSVWFDDRVKRFNFHSNIINQPVDGEHPRLVYGMSVEPRHVFSAVGALHNVPETCDFEFDGKVKEGIYVTMVTFPDGSKEFRTGDRYGKTVARFEFQKEFEQNRNVSALSKAEEKERYGNLNTIPNKP